MSEEKIELEFIGISEEEQQELTDEDYQPTIAPDPDFVYALNKKIYDTQEELAGAGGCPPDEHSWRSSFVFGVDRCSICKALRKPRPEVK